MCDTVLNHLATSYLKHFILIQHFILQVSTSDPEEKTEKPSSMDVDKPVSAAPDSSGDNVNEPGQSADAKTAPAGIINQCLTVDHTMPGRGGSVASSDARSLYDLQ